MAARLQLDWRRRRGAPRRRLDQGGLLAPRTIEHCHNADREHRGSRNREPACEAMAMARRSHSSPVTAGCLIVGGSAARAGGGLRVAELLHWRKQRSRAKVAVSACARRAAAAAARSGVEAARRARARHARRLLPHPLFGFPRARAALDGGILPPCNSLSSTGGDFRMRGFKERRRQRLRSAELAVAGRKPPAGRVRSSTRRVSAAPRSAAGPRAQLPRLPPHIAGARQPLGR